MAKITIDTTKWLKPTITVLAVIVLFFVGYKLFKSSGYSLGFAKQKELILLQDKYKKVKLELDSLRIINDSIGKANDDLYIKWSRKNSNFDKLKKKFDEIRSNNASLTADERTDALSKRIRGER